MSLHSLQLITQKLSLADGRNQRRIHEYATSKMNIKWAYVNAKSRVQGRISLYSAVNPKTPLNMFELSFSIYANGKLVSSSNTFTLEKEPSMDKGIAIITVVIKSDGRFDMASDAIVLVDTNGTFSESHLSHLFLKHILSIYLSHSL